MRAERRSCLQRLHQGALGSLVAALYPDAHLTQEDIRPLERILGKEED